MGVYIKGAKMPISCESCPCKAADTFRGIGGCQATGYIPIRKVNQDRPDWCPLIEIPPHGRLVDADALTTVTEMVNGKFKTYIELFEITYAPTIIESEE